MAEVNCEASDESKQVFEQFSKMIVEAKFSPNMSKFQEIFDRDFD